MCTQTKSIKGLTRLPHSIFAEARAAWSVAKHLAGISAKAASTMDSPLSAKALSLRIKPLICLLSVLLLTSATAQTVSIEPLGQWPGFNRAEPFPARAYGVLGRYTSSGHYAFVAAGLGGVVIVDLADPAQPRRVAAHQTEGWIRDVAVSGSIACLGALS